MVSSGRRFTEWLVDKILHNEFDVLDWDGVHRGGESYCIKREAGDSARAKKIVTVRFLVDADGSSKRGVDVVGSSGSLSLSLPLSEIIAKVGVDSFQARRAIDELSRALERAGEHDVSTDSNT